MWSAAASPRRSRFAAKAGRRRFLCSAHRVLFCHSESAAADEESSGSPLLQRVPNTSLLRVGLFPYQIPNLKSAIASLRPILSPTVIPNARCGVRDLSAGAPHVASTCGPSPMSNLKSAISFPPLCSPRSSALPASAICESRPGRGGATQFSPACKRWVPDVQKSRALDGRHKWAHTSSQELPPPKPARDPHPKIQPQHRAARRPCLSPPPPLNFAP